MIGVSPCLPAGSLCVRPGRVYVRLDLLYNRASYSGQATRPFAAHLEASYGDRANERLPFALNGTVRAILDFWPPHLHFPDDLIQGVDGAVE